MENLLEITIKKGSITKDTFEIKNNFVFNNFRVAYGLKLNDGEYVGIWSNEKLIEFRTYLKDLLFRVSEEIVMTDFVDDCNIYQLNSILELMNTIKQIEYYNLSHYECSIKYVEY